MSSSQKPLSALAGPGVTGKVPAGLPNGNSFQANCALPVTGLNPEELHSDGRRAAETEVSLMD